MNIPPVKTLTSNRFLCFLFCGALLLLETAVATAQTRDSSYHESKRLPIEVRQQAAPALAILESGKYLVYELHLTSFIPQPLLLEGIEVYDTRDTLHPLASFTGEQLMRNLKNLRPDDTLQLQLLYGSRAVLFLWVPVQAKLPVALVHRILFGGSRRTALSIAALQVPQQTRPVEIGAPLRGTWLAAQGPDPAFMSVEGHNRLLYPYGGNLAVPQRFAFDWVKLGDDGRAFHGDSTRNDSYYSFGQPVYAVADGIIVSVQEDVDENIPPRMTVPKTAKTVTGNFIVLLMENGISAYYGHLQKNSCVVKKGQHVRKGSVLARVGNTGNSTGPHLHFQLNRGADFWNEGIPFVFPSYTNYGRMSPGMIDEWADYGKAWRAEGSARKVRKKMPTYGTVLLLLP